MIVMGKTMFKICVVNTWICAGMLFICEVISKILPEMGEMLFHSLGGAYSPRFYQVDLEATKSICAIALLINIIAAVWLGVSLYRKEKTREKSA